MNEILQSHVYLAGGNSPLMFCQGPCVSSKSSAKSSPSCRTMRARTRGHLLRHAQLPLSETREHKLPRVKQKLLCLNVSTEAPFQIFVSPPPSHRALSQTLRHLRRHFCRRFRSLPARSDPCAQSHQEHKGCGTVLRCCCCCGCCGCCLTKERPGSLWYAASANLSAPCPPPRPRWRQGSQ